MASRRIWLRVALVALALAILASARALGLFERIGNPEALRDSLVAMGGWGYVVFVAAFTVLQPFGVPGTAFVLAAPLIWPWPVAFALSMAGSMGCSVVGFSFARFLARDWVTARIPARFDRYSAALERRGFVTVFSLRLVFWMPQLLHSFLGVSRVRFWTHFWGSLFGYVLPIFFVSYFGQRALDTLRQVPVSAWLWSAAGLLVAGASFAWARRCSPRLSQPRA